MSSFVQVVISQNELKLAMAKIVYACARSTCLKKSLPQSYVGKRGYVHLESGTSKMRAKMVVQPCSDQWKSITILNSVHKFV